MYPQRVGLAVWLNNIKMARHLRRFGNVHYISRKMRYAIMYVDEPTIEDTLQKLEQFNFVKKIDRSYRHELKTEYQNAKPDKAKEYDYKMGI
ncbi:YlbG family protein [Bacillus horti]|uniref:UPF0298 protein J2S11_000471 n=1 Tax=Caldalkalibacillus horti TaxID=77523 RepID=A0ABT9VUA6_9BACI|nr:DUF2129 domain-containing protein [Bacillus horti]MDQ0164571.1 uncharacterized protein YlbG (UPF0298 family) [Bacillus horti]